MPITKRKKRPPVKNAPPKKKKVVKKNPVKKKTSALRSKMKEQLIKRLKEDQARKETGGRGIFKAGTGATFWKPEGGDHLIDIIPFFAGSNHPTVPEGESAYNLRVKVHYGIGPGEDKSALCLQETFGKPCPICEHRLVLKNEGADDDTWKSLYPKKRAVYNILCWDSTREEDKGVQIWEVSEFYFQKHLDTLVKGPRRPGRDNDTLIPFTDVDEGKSIGFTINPPRSRNDFAEYIGHSFADRDYAIDDDTLESSMALDELIHIPTYDEVFEEYWGEPSDGEAVEEDEGTEEDPTDDPDDYYEEGEEETEEEGEEETEEEGEEVEGEENECPGGGTFGVDTSDLDECEDCDIWQECLQEQQEKLRERKKPRKKAVNKRGHKKLRKRT